MEERIVIDAGRYIDLDCISSVITKADGDIKVRVIGSDEPLIYTLRDMTGKEFVEMFKAYKAEQQELQMKQVKALQSIAESLQKSTQKESTDKYPISTKFKEGGI